MAAYLGANEAAQSESLVLTGVQAGGGVHVADVDLHGGVVLGSDQTVSPRAVANTKHKQGTKVSSVLDMAAAVTGPRGYCLATYHLRGMYWSTVTP